MINPTEKDIGRSVIYKGFGSVKSELGVITSFNDSFVFVRYAHQHPTANGQATHRSNLYWENPDLTDDFEVIK